MPVAVIIVSCFFFLLSYIIYAEVLRENIYLSRTIEVQKNQQVVDTGLYAVVRHPMYSATVIMFLSIPLIKKVSGFFNFLLRKLFPSVIIKKIDEFYRGEYL